MEQDNPSQQVHDTAPGPHRRAVPGGACEHAAHVSTRDDRVTVSGKFFHLGQQKWFLKGLTYGPFAGGSDSASHLPAAPQLKADFAQIRHLGATCIRVYHVPPRWVLDEALQNDLRVFVDVPWEKHRCFFEDWSAQEGARTAVRQAVSALGNHPALFALSVVNEVPSDIVRFYGRDRVGRFITELFDVVKHAEPTCLATFANYPSTEFLNPQGGDFSCFNVYLEEEEALAGYCDRLQHLAGHRPLILGEFGADSIRKGEAQQAELLAKHVRRVFRHGLAGSFAFSFTDDWFTGGHQVGDWAFGITRSDRSEKPAAAALRAAWFAATDEAADEEGLPRVSVVVCSYNGAATLRECLQSLQSLDYPDYEVILIDDGSTDTTPSIAADFPSIRYIRQDNFGLSAARNAGLYAATGEVVAYTDSDCVADSRWLRCLVRAMRDGNVEAIGGPNVPPPSDGWTAKCVAASPGGPSHVMFDDQLAEHVPGCNMAFRRARLIEIGGFDPQFRQAGDDVDICWRFLDANLNVGYAAAALVWHHRRTTVNAYLRQQAGYGRAEAMVVLKHPKRAGLCGDSTWHGIIYGDGAIGLATVPDTIYHGRFGSGSFQIVYRSNRYTPWIYLTLLEWHAIALVIAVASIGWAPFGFVALAMWGLTLCSAVRSAVLAPLPSDAPWWCRPLVGLLYLAQPVVRSWQRHSYRLRHGPGVRDNSRIATPASQPELQVKALSMTVFDQYWTSSQGRGREELLPAIVRHARRAGGHGDFEAEWGAHDIELWPSPWQMARVRTATEELGEGRRFTRARTFLYLTPLGKFCVIACVVWLLASLAAAHAWMPAIASVPAIALAAAITVSRIRCRRAISMLLGEAAAEVGLEPVPLNGRPSKKTTEEATIAPAAASPLPRMLVELTQPNPDHRDQPVMQMDKLQSDKRHPRTKPALEEASSPGALSI